MTTRIVLVRGINVGGHNRLPMADLRDVLTELGCRDVQTYLQSGNAVVTAGPKNLAPRIETALQQRLDLDVRVIVITAAELRAIAKANSFPGRESTPKQLHVAFFEAPPDPAKIKEVGTTHGEDELAIGKRVLYLSYSDTSHNSPLTAALRRIGGVSTARNWITVTKLIELADATG